MPFDPATLACKAGADESTCLTPPQVDAVEEDLRRREESAHRRADLHRLAARQRRLRRRRRSRAGGSTSLDPKEPSRVGVFKYFLFNDPNWDVRTLDYDRDLAYAEQRLPHMHAVDRDLTPFKKSGGKLICTPAGWIRSCRRRTPPRYYEGVAKAMGGLRQDARLLPALHWRRAWATAPAGPGPNQFDALTALEQWVEKGVAPDKLIATHSTNGKVDRTRPLCPYPQVARYKGTGSIDDAANFACVTPEAAPARRHPSGAVRNERRRGANSSQTSLRRRRRVAAGEPTPDCSPSGTLFPGFESRKIQTSGATINVLRGGSGPPLLLHPRLSADARRVAQDRAAAGAAVHGRDDRPSRLRRQQQAAGRREPCRTTRSARWRSIRSR